jgi:hypothetical protein
MENRKRVPDSQEILWIRIYQSSEIHEVDVVKKIVEENSMLATLVTSKQDGKWRFPELLDFHWFTS